MTSFGGGPSNSEQPLGSPAPGEVNDFHRYDDADSSPESHHHTLGPEQNQASPGFHTHDGRNSPLLPKVQAPVGAISLWPTATAPSNHVICNGQAISRTTYPSLFALIGTTFGVGDNSTTFNVPNFTNRFPIGAGTVLLAGVGGAFNHNHNSGTHTHAGDSHGHTDTGHAHNVNHSHSNAAHAHGGGGHIHGLGDHVHGVSHGHTGSQPGHAHTVSHNHGGVTTGGGVTTTQNPSTTTQTPGVTVDTNFFNSGGPSANSYGPSGGTDAAGITIDANNFNTTTNAASIAANNGTTGTATSSAADANPPYLGIYFIIKAL